MGGTAMATRNVIADNTRRPYNSRWKLSPTRFWKIFVSLLELPMVEATLNQEAMEEVLQKLYHIDVKSCFRRWRQAWSSVERRRP